MELSWQMLVACCMHYSTHDGVLKKTVDNKISKFQFCLEPQLLYCISHQLWCFSGTLLGPLTHCVGLERAGSSTRLSHMRRLGKMLELRLLIIGQTADSTGPWSLDTALNRHERPICKMRLYEPASKQQTSCVPSLHVHRADRAFLNRTECSSCDVTSSYK
jgi:hypothetical protein